MSILLLLLILGNSVKAQNHFKDKPRRGGSNKRSSEISVHIEPNLGITSAWLGLIRSEQYDNDIKPFVGLNISLTTDEIPLENLKVTTGIVYSNNSFKEHYTNSAIKFYNRYNMTFIHLVELDYSMIQVPISISYLFRIKESFIPFISIGYNNIFLIKPEYKVLRTEEITEDTQYIEEHSANIRTYEHGFFTNLGLNYKISSNSNLIFKLGYEYRFPTSATHIDTSILDYTYVNSLKFNIGYEYKF